MFPCQLKYKTFQSSVSPTEKSANKLENMNVKASLDPPEGGFN